MLDTITLMKNIKFQEIKFPPLPKRQAVIDYFNALRFDDGQMLKYEEICHWHSAAHIRSRVDKIHPDFEEQNQHTTTYFKKDPEFTQAYRNTACIWPWLVRRATDIRWNDNIDVLVFIFYTLFEVYGISAVTQMVLWERLLVSQHPHKTQNIWVPQVAISHVFFSAVFGVKLEYHALSHVVQIYTYLSSVMVHNTSDKNKVDVQFAGYSITNNKVFNYDKDCDRPVRAKEIRLEGLMQVIKEQVEELSEELSET